MNEPENRIIFKDLEGILHDIRHLVENYNRAVMLIEQEKTATAINSLP